MKNSCKNNTDRLVTFELAIWEEAVVSSKTKLSRFISNSEEDTPTL